LCCCTFPTTRHDNQSVIAQPIHGTSVTGIIGTVNRIAEHTVSLRGRKWNSCAVRMEGSAITFAEAGEATYQTNNNNMKKLYQGFYYMGGMERSILFVADDGDDGRKEFRCALKAFVRDLHAIKFDKTDFSPVTNVFDYRSKHEYRVELVSESK
jgi:hypothetical protein